MLDPYGRTSPRGDRWLQNGSIDVSSLAPSVIYFVVLDGTAPQCDQAGGRSSA
jgi:hypothetical protein